MGRKDPKFKSGTQLRRILVNDDRLKTLVKGRVYPCVAPEGTNDDFIIYARSNYAIDDTKMGITSQTAKIDLFVIGNDYERSQEIAEAVFLALEGAHTDENGVLTKIELTDSSEGYEEGKFIQTMEFKIT